MAVTRRFYEKNKEIAGRETKREGWAREREEREEKGRARMDTVAFCTTGAYIAVRTYIHT